MKRLDYRETLRRIGILTVLAKFDPRVAGTPPLGLDLPTSDIDVLCFAPDPTHFAAVVWAGFHDRTGFAIRQWVGADRPVIADFTAYDWPIQVFGQAKPVHEQNGWRHFVVERRLLELGGIKFRAAVARARSGGLKTEPAFATVLGLAGDPYAALLDLERHPDASLLRCLESAGFTR